jgi:RimJ/RimL family protein N-acetyltransferase
MTLRPLSTTPTTAITAKPLSVELRDVAWEDLPAFFEHQHDPEANTMAGFPTRNRDAFMSHWAKILNEKTAIVKTILFEGSVAGNVVCWESFGDQRIGYWVARELWGKGIATRALGAFMQLVSIRPLVAHVASHNLGSIRVLEHCGFVVSSDSGDELIFHCSVAAPSVRGC